MCAPCKIIIDAGAEAAARGKSPVAAMARMAGLVVHEMPAWAQNEMSRIDLTYIPARWGAADASVDKIDRRWYESTVAVLEKVIAETERA